MTFRDHLARQTRHAFTLFGEDAILAPMGDSRRTVRIIRGEEVAEGTIQGFSYDTDVGRFNLMVEEVPILVKGDRILVDDQWYEIETPPRKTKKGLVWKVEAQPVDET